MRHPRPTSAGQEHHDEILERAAQIVTDSGDGMGALDQPTDQGGGWFRCIIHHPNGRRFIFVTATPALVIVAFVVHDSNGQWLQVIGQDHQALRLPIRTRHRPSRAFVTGEPAHHELREIEAFMAKTPGGQA